MKGKTTDDILQNGLEEVASSDVHVMFQEDYLIPWLSILDNVGVGTGREKGWQFHVQRALHQVGFIDRAKEWPSVPSGVKNNV